MPDEFLDTMLEIHCVLPVIKGCHTSGWIPPDHHYHSWHLAGKQRCSSFLARVLDLCRFDLIVDEMKMPDRKSVV